MSNNERMQRSILFEVAITRPIIILLLLLYHSLSPYCGTWNQIDGIEAVTFYSVLGHFIHGFHLEAMTLLSGYLLAFLHLERGKKNDIQTIITKKSQRLILPAIVFGIVYFFMFKYDKGYDLKDCPFMILDGIGHLWYLPMIFWLFMIISLLDSFRLSKDLILLLSIVLYFLPIPISLHFGLEQVPHYLFFFYLGYYCRYRFIGLQKINAKFSLAICFCLYLLCFFNWISGFIYLDNSLLTMQSFIIRLCGCGMVLFFMLCLSSFRFSPFIQRSAMECSNMCYGVYIVHQFILIYLYYHTSYPVAVGSYLLPWVSFLVTLVSSVILVYAFRKMRIGRILT